MPRSVGSAIATSNPSGTSRRGMTLCCRRKAGDTSLANSASSGCSLGSSAGNNASASTADSSCHSGAIAASLVVPGNGSCLSDERAIAHIHVLRVRMPVFSAPMGGALHISSIRRLYRQAQSARRAGRYSNLPYDSCQRDGFATIGQKLCVATLAPVCAVLHIFTRDERIPLNWTAALNECCRY